MFCFCFKGLLSVRVENRWRRQQREAGRRPADRTGGSQRRRRQSWLGAGTQHAPVVKAAEMGKALTSQQGLLYFTNFPGTMSESRNKLDVGIEVKSWL